MIEKKSIVDVLEALAHEVRLDVFLLLIQAGPEGMAAGKLTERLRVPPNALSFHLTRLRHAGLVESRRQGKQIIYSAVFSKVEGLMDFLSINCCRDSEAVCSPACTNRRQGSAGKRRSSTASPKRIKEDSHG